MADDKKSPAGSILQALLANPDPDPGGRKLLDEHGGVDREAVLAYLNSKRRAGDAPLVCPLSGHNEWLVMPRLVHMLLSRTKNDSGFENSRTGGSWQYIEVVCGACGYSFFLNYLVISQFNLDKSNG